MDVEDDDFFDDFMNNEDDDEAADCEKEEMEHVGQLPQFVTQYESLRTRMEEVDELARQLNVVTYIQKKMSSCISHRSSDFPLKSTFEYRRLSTDSPLLLIHISNHSSYRLDGWSLSINLSPISMEYNSCASYSVSESFPLGILESGQTEVVESTVSSHHTTIPMLVHIVAIKKFDMENFKKTFNIPLDNVMITYFDMMIIPQDKTRNAPTTGSFSLRIPSCLIDLLSGCPDDDDPSRLFHLLFPHLLISPSTSFLSLSLILDKNEHHVVHISIDRHPTFFTISISLRNVLIRSLLKWQLQLLLSLKACKTLKRPHNINPLSSLVDFCSVEKLYNSITGDFL